MNKLGFVRTLGFVRLYRLYRLYRGRMGKDEDGREIGWFPGFVRISGGLNGN